MAKKKAKKRPEAKAAGTARRRGGAGIGLKLLGFLLLVLGLILLPSATLLAAGMVPTVLAFLTDADHRKTAAISVGTVNLCGVIPFEITLWEGANTMGHAGLLLRQVETWAVMYGAAAIGAVIYYAVPPLVGGFIALRSEARLAELERRQAQLREAWGEDVSGSRPPARRQAAQAEARAA